MLTLCAIWGRFSLGLGYSRGAQPNCGSIQAATAPILGAPGCFWLLPNPRALPESLLGIPEPHWGRTGAVLGCSWAGLGPRLGNKKILERTEGPFWVLFGAFWALFGCPFGPLRLPVPDMNIFEALWTLPPP